MRIELIYEYIRQRELLSKSAFVANLDAHVLLFKRWQVTRMAEKTMTTNIESPPNALLELLDEQRLRLHKEAFEFRLFRLPLSGTSWSVGRVSEKDVVIAHRSVSKKHAELSLGADASLLVADSGSKNGTWVESKRVTADRPMLMWSKQQLRLGSIALRFLVASDFYDLLGGLVTPAQ
jgi:hypothetical protein